MADPNEAPSPAALREIAECTTDAEELRQLRAEYDAIAKLVNHGGRSRPLYLVVKDALEAKDREIAEVDAVIAWELNLHCEGLSASTRS